MEEVNSFLKQFGEMCESEAPDSMVTVNMEDFLEALLVRYWVLLSRGDLYWDCLAFFGHFELCISCYLAFLYFIECIQCTQLN